MTSNKEKRRSISSVQPPGTIQYIVKDNDTLRSIAAFHEVKLSALKEANKLMSEIIFPDQLLYIPSVGYKLQRKYSDHLDPGSRLIPGHAERQPKSQVLSPPRPLNNDELAKIDEECHHKFVKMNAVYTLDNMRVAGVLLVTPDGVMFDPDINDPIVRQKGADEFQLVDSIMSVISISVFHSDQILKDINENKKSSEKVSDSCDKVTNNSENTNKENIGEKFDENIRFIKDKNVNNHLKDDKNNQIEDGNKNKCKAENGGGDEAKKDNENVVEMSSKSENDNGDELKSGSKENNSLDNSLTNNIKLIDTSNKNESNTVNSESNDVDMQNNEFSVEISKSLNCKENKHEFEKSACYNKDPVHIRLKVHTNIDALKTFKDVGKHKKLQRWFAVSCDRKIDQLYAFFKKWSPSLVAGFESEDYYFKEVEAGSGVGKLMEEEEKKEGSWVSNMKLSKDWQLVSAKELRRLKVVLEVRLLPLPELSCPSLIVKEEHIRTLACNLPALGEGMPWKLAYSSDRDGFSLQTLYRKMPGYESIFILLIEDTHCRIFGAVLVGELRIQEHFQGSGESYLFTFYPDFKRFNWTGINDFFFKGNHDSLVIGASEGDNGLWLDGELFHGRTQECKTFDNELLTNPQDFVVKCLEVWTLK